MRKAMALFLVVLMALSMVPMAFAEDGNATADPADDGAGDGNETEPEEPEVPEGDDNETEPEEPEVPEGEDNETEDEEEEEDVVEIPDNVTDEAGSTPDSWTWGIDRAIEKISIKLTFGKSAKAKKGLAHARERLMEVQAMIAQKRMAQAARAQEAYDEIMEDVGENVDALGNGDEIGDLEDTAEIDQAIAENEELVAQVGKLKTKFKGLTAEQEDAVNAIVGSLGDTTSDVDVKVQAKKDKVKIKIKAKGGLTDEEVSSIAAQVEEAVASGKKVDVKIKNKKAKANGGDDDEVESEDESEDEPEDGDDDEDGLKGKGKSPKDDKGSKDKGKNK